MIKAAIYGAGAMGGALGALIEKSGGKIDLYTRNVSHVQAVRKNGLTLRLVADGRSFTVNPSIFTPEEMPLRTLENGKYDVIFLMTKQRENKEIVSFLSEYLTENGALVTTQNGLPEAEIAKIVKEERTFGCVCSFGANFETAGEACLTSTLSTVKICVGAFRVNCGGVKNEAKDREEYIQKNLKNIRSLLKPIVKITNENFYRETDNLVGVRYAKLIVNAAFSSLSAATGFTFGEIAKHKRTRKIALCVMRETLNVAKAQNVKIDSIQGRNVEKLLKRAKPPFGTIKDAILLAMLPRFVKNHKDSVSGMLLDIKRGRRSEIDFIAGAVKSAGAEVGVSTPYCAALVNVVRAVENGEAELTERNCDFLKI